METQTAVIIFLFFLFSKFLIKIYLELRARNYLKTHRDVHPFFQAIVTKEENERSIAYTLEKKTLSIILNLLHPLFMLFWIYLGYQFIQSVATNHVSSVTGQGIIFFILLSIISSIISLPVEIIETFRIDEKYGHNKTTGKLFIVDQVKSILISIPLISILAGSLLYFHSLAPNLWWLFAWAFFTFFQLSLFIIYPRFIAPLFNKFSELPEGELRNGIMKLFNDAGRGVEKILIMDASKRSSKKNAYFTGFGKNKKIVLFDTLVNTHSADEVVAIFAHELGHAKLLHIPKKIGMMIFGSLLFFYFLHLFETMKLGTLLFPHLEFAPYILFAIFIDLSGIISFFSIPFFNYLSRKDEFAADQYAKNLGYGPTMQQVLAKLNRDNGSPLDVDPLYSTIYYSHPAPIERFVRLQG